jgi:hypothetical protein
MVVMDWHLDHPETPLFDACHHLDGDAATIAV